MLSTPIKAAPCSCLARIVLTFESYKLSMCTGIPKMISMPDRSIYLTIKSLSLIFILFHCSAVDYSYRVVIASAIFYEARQSGFFMPLNHSDCRAIACNDLDYSIVLDTRLRGYDGTRVFILK